MVVSLRFADILPTSVLTRRFARLPCGHFPPLVQSSVPRPSVSQGQDQPGAYTVGFPFYLTSQYPAFLNRKEGRIDSGISYNPLIPLLRPLNRPTIRLVLLRLPLVAPTVTGQRSKQSVGDLARKHSTPSSRTGAVRCLHTCGCTSAPTSIHLGATIVQVFVLFC